jgi:GAF domain-containing protein
MEEETKTKWAKIRHFLTPPAFERDEDRRVARLLNAILLTVLLFSVVAPFLFTVFDLRLLAINFIFGVAGFILAGVLKWLLNKKRLQLSSLLLVLGLLALFTFDLYSFNGIRSAAIMGYVFVVLLAGLLLGQGAAIGFAVVSVLITLILFVLENRGFLSYEVRGAVWSDWLQFVINLSLIVLAVRFALLSISEGFTRARDTAQALRERNRDLERSRRTLEDRTQELERRSRYLEATTSVARDATSVLDPQDLIGRVVSLISERFGFYHTGILLIDAAGEWAELQAASSEGGQHMLARGHRLRVGKEGVVGYVTGQGVARIAVDTGADAVYFDNPDLPETRSELALPLRARGEIIGALDVQSKMPEAFSEEDVDVLQALADQVAMAISNARLLGQVQESLEAERRAYGELSREAWQELIEKRLDLGFLSYADTTVPAGDLWRPEMRKALYTGQITLDDEGERVAIPIKVRGEVVGVIDGSKPAGEGEWKAEEIELLETLTGQLSQALESARLYEDTQRRAAREQLIGEVASRMRETLDMETVMQTALQEIGDALEIGQIKLRMRDVEDR